MLYPSRKIHTQKISPWHPRKGEQPQASPEGSPLITQSSHALLGNTGHSAGWIQLQGGEQGVQAVVPKAERAPGTSLAADSGRNPPVPSGSCDTQGGCAVPPWLTPKGKFIPWSAWAMRFWDQTGDDRALTCWWFTFQDRNHVIENLWATQEIKRLPGSSLQNVPLNPALQNCRRLESCQANTDAEDVEFSGIKNILGSLHFSVPTSVTTAGDTDRRAPF